jgi:hypothetical protein
VAQIELVSSPKQPPRWLRGLWQAPFEVAIAALVVAQATLGIFDWGGRNPTDVLLPGWLEIGFDICYLIAGLAIIAGVFRFRGDIEGAGLVLLSFILVGRGLAYGYVLDWAPRTIITLAFSGLVVTACSIRISLLRGWRVG